MSGRILPDLTQNVVALVQPTKYGRIETGAVKRLFDQGFDDGEIATRLGCSRMTVFNHRKKLGLLRRVGRAKAVDQAPRTFISRHEPKDLDGRPATMPPVNHPALSEARTIYPSTIHDPSGLLNLLIKGENSWKIGGEIIKGRWKGFPIYTLTLEERATCPTGCALWRSCYGNQMNWAKRVRHGQALEERLGYEVGLLSFRHPGGFAVRLHVLGDFYSVAYVDLWRRLIDQFPSLHVFGFSARHAGADDPIAAALIDLIADRWSRFAVRLSNAPVDQFSTVTIEHPLQRPADAIICPQQQGKTASCGTCGLCWATSRRIAFLRH